MKKKNLFMFALASFMFAACSENLPDGGDDGGGTGAGEIGRASCRERV